MSATAYPASTAVVPAGAVPRRTSAGRSFALPKSERRYLILLAVLFGILTWMGDEPAAGSTPRGGEGVSAGDARRVQDYYREFQADDRLLTLAGGVQVKESNYHGVEVGERRLYYRAAPHTSFDPWTRRAVSESQVVIVARLDTDTDFPVVIYRLAGQ